MLVQVLAGVTSTAVLGIGSYMLKNLITIASVLSRLETRQEDDGRRIQSLETWKMDRDAEAVAYRNSYSVRRPTPYTPY